MTDPLLPPNASPMEAALDAVFARIGDVPVPNAALWDPATCPEAFLPWLAWQLRAEWDGEWSTQTQRDVIAQALAVHRRRGTAGAVRRALTAAGYAPQLIEEGKPTNRYDGSMVYNGSETYGGVGDWALYALTFTLGVPWQLSELAIIRRVAESAAPARSELAMLVYSEGIQPEDAGVSDATPQYDHLRYRFYDGSYQYDGAIDYSGVQTTAGAWA